MSFIIAGFNQTDPDAFRLLVESSAVKELVNIKREGFFLLIYTLLFQSLFQCLGENLIDLPLVA